MNYRQVVLIGLSCMASFAAVYPATADDYGASVILNAKDDSIQVPPVDEVVITGKKETLSQLRVQITQAEDAFFEAFNEVNTDSRYHTLCDMETATEMRQKIHVCKPDFVSAAFQDAKRLGELDLATSLIDSRMPLYKARVHELTHKNPKLAKALGRYYALTQHYQAVRKERFKGRWIVAE